MPDAAPPLRVRRLSHAGHCSCGQLIAVGDPAAWRPDDDRIWCLDCVASGVADAVLTAEAQAAETLAQPASVTRLHAITELRDGGRSASPGAHRAREDALIREQGRHPSALMMGMTDAPISTQAWQAGSAEAERVVCDRLTELGQVVSVLHGRRFPLARANVNHVVIGPNGVFVIAVKRYRNALLTVQPPATLLVRGRDRSALITSMAAPIDAVRRVVDESEADGLPVTGVLCVMDARLQPFDRVELLGVAIRDADGTLDLVKDSGPLDHAGRDGLARMIAARLPVRG
jgi:hypothetical protein